MSDERIEEDMPEILDAAQILVEHRRTFERCLDHSIRHWANLYESFPLWWGTLYIYLPRLRLRRLLSATVRRLDLRR